MSIATTFLQAAPAGEVCLPDVVDLLDSIVSSAEPAVVLTSVASVCVPVICLSAVAAISEAGERTYTVANPREHAPQRRVSNPDDRDAVTAFGGVFVSHTSVATEFRGSATANHGAYEGVLVLTFARPGPTHSLLGQLVVDRAVALISLERLHDNAEMYRTNADNLTAALRSNRDIGIALGIIMSRYQLTEADAFDLIRISSQDTQRKVRDVAREIGQTGLFVLPDRARAMHPRVRSVAARADMVPLARRTPC